MRPTFTIRVSRQSDYFRIPEFLRDNPIPEANPLDRDAVIRRNPYYRDSPRGRRILDQYCCRARELPISDPPMQRICEAMTLYSFVTVGSCDGHAKRIPYVYFGESLYCNPFPKVANSSGGFHEVNRIEILKAAIEKATPILRFAWGLAPEDDAYYLLLEVTQDKPVNLPADYDALLFDIDLLGLTIEDHCDRIVHGGK